MLASYVSWNITHSRKLDTAQAAILSQGFYKLRADVKTGIAKEIKEPWETNKKAFCFLALWINVKYKRICNTTTHYCGLHTLIRRKTTLHMYI